jgi:hypothetical protein
MSLKQQYNKDSEHFFNEACKFMDDPNISNEKKDKWLPKFKELLNNLKKLIDDIEKEQGHEVTEDEILTGFKEVTRD